MTKMRDSDRRRLFRLHELFLKVEKESLDHHLNSADLEKIKELLSEFVDHEDNLIRRLSDVRHHLHSGLSVRQFSYFVVPLERILAKEVQDDDFMVESIDRDQIVSQEKIPFYFVLDNIRSAFNVGSILRSADGLGVSEVFLTGYTPVPEQNKVKKTALGADRYAKWSYHEDIQLLIHDLKNRDIQIVALETSPLAKSIYIDWNKKPTAVILGNERFGLDPKIIQLCDELRIVPMQGQKNSLNVGVCAGIVASEWRRQWQSL